MGYLIIMYDDYAINSTVINEVLIKRKLRGRISVDNIW